MWSNNPASRSREDGKGSSMGRDTKTIQLQSELNARIFYVSEPAEKQSYGIACCCFLSSQRIYATMPA
jgi:hypothetical protein